MAVLSPFGGLGLGGRAAKEREKKGGGDMGERVVGGFARVSSTTQLALTPLPSSRGYLQPLLSRSPPVAEGEYQLLSARAGQTARL